MFESKLTHLQLSILALSSALLGVSMVLIGHHRHIQLTTDFFLISQWLPENVFNGLAGGAFLLIAVLSVLTAFKPQMREALGKVLIVVSTVPLLSLFSSSMWIADLGGFPAIGSGQGVIKYFALLAIGIMLSGLVKNLHAQKAVAVFPVVLVLLWIGGMKFTLLEAKGIEALVNTSPFMSWMYQVWDLQTTSNLIGVYDLLALTLLLLSLRFKVLLLPGLAMSGAVFVVTQTFLFSWDAALSSETILSTGGHFLIKDLWFISNLVWFYQLQKDA